MTKTAALAEIEARVEDERERTMLLRQQLDCECPDPACRVAHES